MEFKHSIPQFSTESSSLCVLNTSYWVTQLRMSTKVKLFCKSHHTGIEWLWISAVLVCLIENIMKAVHVCLHSNIDLDI